MNTGDNVLLKNGVNTSGLLKLYKIFKKYMKYPSFNAMMDGKSKYSELQFETIQGFLTGSMEPAQIVTDIKNCLEFLKGEGFDEYCWENFEKYAIMNLREQRQEKEVKQKNDKEDVVYTSLHIDDKYIYEQGFNNGFSYFIKYDRNGGEWEQVKDFEVGGIIHRPHYGQELHKSVVHLPKEPGEYGTYEDLEKDIKKHINKYLDVSEDYEQLAFYNILQSWVYQRFNTLNYIRALGDTGTGKSRFLDTIGLLHYKPMVVAGALTPAVIFRLIDKWKGTLIIDEGDQDKSEETNTFIKIMNCGYERGRAVGRCDKNDPNQIDFFEVFCPKVITTRRRFEDKATEARCMTTIMTQTHRTDIPDTLLDEFYEETRILRNKLLLWRLRNYHKIDPKAGMKIDLSEFEPRLRQVNRSFVSLFADRKEEIEKFKENLRHYQESLIEERASSFDGIIINVLAEMVANGWESPSPGDIKEQLDQKNIHFQYPVTSHKIAKLLRGMGLDFHRMKISGRTKVALLMKKDIMENIFSRYIFEEEVLENLSSKGYSVTKVTGLLGRVKIMEKSNIIEKSDEISFVEDFQKKPLGPSNSSNSSNPVTQKNIAITEEIVVDYLMKKGSVKIEIMKKELNLSDRLIDKMKARGWFMENPAGVARKL